MMMSVSQQGMMLRFIHYLTVSSVLIMYLAYSKQTGLMRMQTVAFHKDVRFPQFHANGTHSFQKRPTDGQGEDEPPFPLPPPPPLLRLPTVPISTNPRWRPTDVINNMLPVFRSAYQKQNTRGGRRRGREARDIFNRPAQRKPAKGNGAPQSAYPVSAAFNRMLVCIVFLYL